MPSSTLMSSPSRFKSSPDVSVAIFSAPISLAINLREMKADYDKHPGVIPSNLKTKSHAFQLSSFLHVKQF